MKQNPINIEYVSPKVLREAPFNPRKIDEESLKRLAKLLDSHGFVDPVIARRGDDLLIAGHQNELRQKPDERVICGLLGQLSLLHLRCLFLQ